MKLFFISVLTWSVVAQGIKDNNFKPQCFIAPINWANLNQ